MRIAIEAQRLFREKKHGMDVVVLELIKNLQQIDKVNEYFILVKPDSDKCISETENFRIIELGGGPYPIWEQVALPRAAKKLKCDLLHCTSNTAPEMPGLPLVLTLHDIIYMEGGFFSLLKDKGTAYQRFGNVYRRHIVPIVVRKSARVITVSEYEKERIAAFFKLEPSKLRAVYNGVGEHFKPITDPLVAQNIREKYHLPAHYFFFLGNTVQKKNTPGTLKAYSIFREKTGMDIPLMMLDFDLQDLTAILAEIGQPGLIEHIHLTGYVNNAELPGIYGLADLFLYPSFRESFGIPILEAQACRTPVITSNTSSMPEIAGDAAMIIDPYKPEEIADAMIRLMKEDAYRQDMVRRGLVNASRFSWRAMAEKVLGIYEEVGREVH
ncbi:MAG: glycosyltransferase family 1 protein [Bacteroidales bacterium]|jgi:glycosyltransferase involved in cell wall biosynthesis